MDLAATFRKVSLANELANNPALALEFSDPDGVRSGKSGWSFGECQFDLNNNPAAAACLKECGFTAAEIAGLKAQTIDPKPLEPKLNAAIIEAYDQHQLAYCVDHAEAWMKRHNIVPADDAAILAVADYANQYGSPSDNNKPGNLVHYLPLLGRPFTAADVLQFKLQTKYGQAHPGDCRRRYDNLVAVCRAEA